MTLSKGYKNLGEKIISTITTRKNWNIYLTGENVKITISYQQYVKLWTAANTLKEQVLKSSSLPVKFRKFRKAAYLNANIGVLDHSHAYFLFYKCSKKLSRNCYTCITCIITWKIIPMIFLIFICIKRSNPFPQLQNTEERKKGRGKRKTVPEILGIIREKNVINKKIPNLCVLSAKCIFFSVFHRT